MTAAAAPAATLILVLSAGTAAQASGPGAQDIPAFYDEHCAACHTIGGGAQAGPDLKQITGRRDREWLVRFLVDPEGLVARRDPVASKLVAEWDGAVMPSTPGLTPAIAAALLDYLDQRSADRPQSAAPAAELPPTAEEIARGRGLFTGDHRLERGAPACLACHDAGALAGGTLGPSLTGSGRRLGGTRGLTAWLAAPPTPLMRAIYRARPLSEPEARAVAAWLGQAGGIESGRWAAAWRVGRAAAAVAILLLVAMGYLWRGRFRAVRAPMVAALPVAHGIRPGGSR